MVRTFLLAVAMAFVLVTPLAAPAPTIGSLTQAQETRDCVVYVTRTGERYHKEWCSYLRYSRFAISRSEAIQRGYTPCKRCGGSDCER